MLAARPVCITEGLSGIKINSVCCGSTYSLAVTGTHTSQLYCISTEDCVAQLLAWSSPGAPHSTAGSAMVTWIKS